MAKCPLVLVEWEDSRRPDPAWTHLADRESGDVVKCASVGWLIRDDDVKELAPNMGDVTEDLQVCGVISIPARCVLKITRLKEPKITAFSEAASSSRPDSEPNQQAPSPPSASVSSRPAPSRPA